MSYRNYGRSAPTIQAPGDHVSPTQDYSESVLVEQPAIALLEKLGWEPHNAYQEFDHGTSTLGRETKAEIILKVRLRLALLDLNPKAPPEAIHGAIEELCRDRSRMSAVAANREQYHLLKNGVRVSVPDLEGEGETVERVRVIDWEDPANNDFLICSQFWVTGEMHTRRADLVGFVNGLPLLFIELKAVHRRLETAFSGNLRDYKDTIPQLFWLNALIILSNGSQSRVGSITAGWEHFAEWKKVNDESESGRVSLETMLRGVCEPGRFLDLVENFTLFQEVSGGLIKLTAKNHQYLGVNNALEALADVRSRDGRLGVFWHTQGSGKSVSMMFFAQKVLRKVPGNWTFVIVTDRQELDGQIYKHFASAGVLTERHAQAASSRQLRQLLTEDHRYVFTLIHKFRTEKGEAHPVLSERRDIIVITDEAHRSQYDTLALNMRTALPNAAFPAFTGTPLIVGEEKTRQVFGDYVSVYDFRQSVEDGGDRAPLLREPDPRAATGQRGPERGHGGPAGGRGAGRGPGGEVGAGVRPRVPPDHPRRPPGSGGQGPRGTLHRPRLPGQGDDDLHRQGHGNPDVRQGKTGLDGATQGRGGGARKGRE